MQKIVSLLVLFALAALLTWQWQASTGQAVTPAASDYPPPSPTPYIVYSMYAINGYEGEVVAGPRVQPLSPLVLKRIQEEISQALTAEPPDSEVVYQAVSLTPPPDPSTVLDGSTREPIDPETLKEMQRRALQMIANMTSVPADGPTTMGATLEIAGKSIKLPDNVYIHSTVLAMDCLAGAECPEAPLYMLRYKDSDLIVGVSIRSGQIHNPGMDERQNAVSRDAFQWLTDALAK